VFEGLDIQKVVAHLIVVEREYGDLLSVAFPPAGIGVDIACLQLETEPIACSLEFRQHLLAQVATVPLVEEECSHWGIDSGSAGL